MSVDDYKINARVRSVLVRRWIDTAKVDFGTSNGVVYLKGVLRQTYASRSTEGKDVELLTSLMKRVEKEVRAIEGVRDVVFRFSNFEKKGRQWRKKAKKLP